MSRNYLGQEISPYLLQHKDNPVHWRPWGAEAFRVAKSENKPILLSIGYSACHWCHVMAHESFEDEDIAALMNKDFVNIKVDREERPDLDNLYQTALALMGEQGGWPLTMFLTPEGEPFWGGTYFPPAPRFGRPGFPQLLQSVRNVFHSEKDRVRTNADALRRALEGLAKPKGGGFLTFEKLDEVARAALGAVDTRRGGTLGAPKFPQPPFFRFLWHAYKRTGEAALKESVVVTLDNMCQGGIYDHLGGGFARYATDDAWLVPHFEKMLYDNALLVELLTEVYQETRSPLYAQRVGETIAWALREMTVRHPDAANARDEAFAFASAFDADSEGEEGRFYVWSEAEVDALLGEDSEAFKRAYGVTAAGNWEGKNILNRSHAPGLGDPASEDALARSRRILFEARARRVPPGHDDKVLTDWNGLMIAALARAGAVFERPEWIEAAQAAFNFVCLYMNRNGRLLHAWRDGQARHAAVLEDLANMARAGIALYEATGRRMSLDLAEAWVAAANRRYWDTDDGGYFQSPGDADDVLVRAKPVNDNASPSGNGAMMEVLARLHHLTGKPEYRQRAEYLVWLFTADQIDRLIYMPSLLSGFGFLEGAVQVVVAGARGGDADALVRAALDGGPATLVLSRIPPGTALPEGHPAHGKEPLAGKATAYVCVGQTCGLPVTDAGALRRALGEP